MAGVFRKKVAKVSDKSYIKFVIKKTKQPARLIRRI